MKTFAENLAGMESANHLTSLEVLNPDGSQAAVIENKPGSQGSLKLYQYLGMKYGAISPQAAREGLELYAEQTDDAKHAPGKHPNIDRLFQVISSGHTLTIRGNTKQ